MPKWKSNTSSNIYNDGTYLENNPNWHENESPWKARQIEKMMKRNNLCPSTVCEIGCGAGDILNQLSLERHDVDFCGYEISEQAFNICRLKERARLKFQFGNLLEQDESYFDLVMAIDVIEHVEDYLGFLQQLKNRGKYKIFHIPLDLSVQSVFRSHSITKLRNQVGHLHYFTKDTALETLEYSGYEIIDCFYTRGSVDLPSGGWKAGLMRIPRMVGFWIHEDIATRVLGGASLMVLAK